MSAGAVSVAGTTAFSGLALFAGAGEATGLTLLPDFVALLVSIAGAGAWPATGHVFELPRLIAARAEFAFASMVGSTRATEKGQSPSCWAICSFTRLSGCGGV